MQVAQLSGQDASTKSDTLLSHRVLFVLSSLDVGGSERKTVRLANELHARGRQVAIAYLNGPETLSSDVIPGIAVVPLRRRGKFSFGALRRLRSLVLEQQANVVVAVNLYPALYVALLARLPRFKHVCFVSSLNTTDLVGPKASRAIRLYKLVLPAMDLLVFGAEHQRRMWTEKYLNGDSILSGVLYNGIDPAKYRRELIRPWRPEDWPLARDIIGYVGKMRREKSLDHLLRAAAELVKRGFDVGVVLVGEGEQAQALQQLVDELNIRNRVRFVGLVSDVRPYLAGFDVFALTSTSVETFSNAALEALAMQCPLVSSSIGGMPEMLGAGGGKIYATGDVKSLTETLESVLADPRHRDTMGAQGRRTVVQRFSLDAMVDSFDALVASAVDQQVHMQPLPSSGRGSVDT
jgi:glycosyltransferase involved in cell wall biosynthesis